MDASIYVPNATPLQALSAAMNPTSATPAASRLPIGGVLTDPTIVLILLLGAFLGLVRFGLKVETGVGK